MTPGESFQETAALLVHPAFPQLTLGGRRLEKEEEATLATDVTFQASLWNRTPARSRHAERAQPRFLNISQVMAHSHTVV